MMYSRYVMITRDDITKPLYGDAIISLGNIASISLIDSTSTAIILGNLDNIVFETHTVRSKNLTIKYHVLKIPLNKDVLRYVLSRIEPEVIILEDYRLLPLLIRSIGFDKKINNKRVHVITRIDNFRVGALKHFIAFAKDVVSGFRVLASYYRVPMLQYSDALYTISRSIYSVLEKWAKFVGSKIFVWYPTIVEPLVNANEPATLLDVGSNYVLTFQWGFPQLEERIGGRKLPRYNKLLHYISALICTYTVLRTEDVSFVIVGSRKEFLPIISGLSRVKILGFIRNPRIIHQLYRNALMLLISRLGSYGLGISTSTLQALYHGLPVLTDTVNANTLPLRAKGSGVIVEDRYTLWPSIVKKIFEDRRLRENLSLKSKLYYEKLLDIRKHVSTFKKIVDEIMTSQ